ncbi:MAG: hypothetical protein KDJ38_03060 [Gammaproteobacteria bacterium]|nr:hypothetical protein [Gammaproteobacteria bacterium]
MNSVAVQNGKNSKSKSPPRAHVSFLLYGNKTLSLPGEDSAFPAWEYLSYCIIRNPAHLLTHIRRILLCQRPELQHYIPGALHDLFLVLGNRGYPLRDRMLRANEPFLSRDYINQFRHWLSGVYRPEFDDQVCKGAVLAGRQGKLQEKVAGLVRMTRSLTSQGKSVLSEAEERMADGQFDIARSLLEDAIAGGDSNAQLQTLLDEINRREAFWDSKQALETPSDRLDKRS